MYKSYRNQLLDCKSLGYTKDSEFFSFEDNPNLLPAFPSVEMQKAIKSGEWSGINLIKCGKFGGICSSSHPECRKIRLTISAE